MQFNQLGLAEPLLRALDHAGYTEPTPIQQQTIAPALAGRDVLGIAQTGTGKTAAFALPILQRLDKRGTGADRGWRTIRAMILTPTRELAAQVAESFRVYGQFMKLHVVEIYGGVSERPQIDSLRRGFDILVACPGRLLDLMNQGHVKLNSVEVLVLDEADRMLDMGFLPDIRRIVGRVPAKRQTLLFSATLPREIRDLARGMLDKPVEVSVAPQSTTADTVEQCVHMVETERKSELLIHLLGSSEVTRALVFTRTKHRADRVARALSAAGVRAEAIHGNKSQGQRTRALRNFQDGVTRVLVASDIASRGLDIDLVSHVFNYDLPNEPETYVHRIGRTGRAGASGLAVSFCDREEREYLRDIERLIGKRVPLAAGSVAAFEPETAGRSEPGRRQPARSGGGRPPRREEHGHRGPYREHRASANAARSNGGSRGGPRRDTRGDHGRDDRGRDGPGHVSPERGHHARNAPSRGDHARDEDRVPSRDSRGDHHHHRPSHDSPSEPARIPTRDQRGDPRRDPRREPAPIGRPPSGRVRRHPQSQTDRAPDARRAPQNDGRRGPGRPSDRGRGR